MIDTFFGPEPIKLSIVSGGDAIMFMNATPGIFPDRKNGKAVTVVIEQGAPLARGALLELFLGRSMRGSSGRI